MKDLYHKLIKAPHAYALLGVHAGCTVEELKTAHRTLAAMLHPDRNADPTAAECMAKVNVAYNTLNSEPEAYKKRLLHTKGAHACRACKGLGYTARGKGFKATVRTGCAACHGAGVLYGQAL